MGTDQPSDPPWGKAMKGETQDGSPPGGSDGGALPCSVCHLPLGPLCDPFSWPLAGLEKLGLGELQDRHTDSQRAGGHGEPGKRHGTAVQTRALGGQIAPYLEAPESFLLPQHRAQISTRPSRKIRL